MQPDWAQLVAEGVVVGFSAGVSDPPTVQVRFPHVRGRDLDVLVNGQRIGGVQEINVDVVRDPPHGVIHLLRREGDAPNHDWAPADDVELALRLVGDGRLLPLGRWNTSEPMWKPVGVGNTGRIRFTGTVSLTRPTLDDGPFGAVHPDEPMLRLTEAGRRLITGGGESQ
jgi:hypothetical protein